MKNRPHRELLLKEVRRSETDRYWIGDGAECLIEAYEDRERFEGFYGKHAERAKQTERAKQADDVTIPNEDDGDHHYRYLLSFADTGYMRLVIADSCERRLVLSDGDLKLMLLRQPIARETMRETLQLWREMSQRSDVAAQGSVLGQLLDQIEKWSIVELFEEANGIDLGKFF